MYKLALLTIYNLATAFGYSGGISSATLHSPHHGNYQYGVLHQHRGGNNSPHEIDGFVGTGHLDLILANKFGLNSIRQGINDYHQGHDATSTVKVNLQNYETNPFYQSHNQFDYNQQDYQQYHQNHNLHQHQQNHLEDISNSINHLHHSFNDYGGEGIASFVGKYDHGNGATSSTNFNFKSSASVPYYPYEGEDFTGHNDARIDHTALNGNDHKTGQTSSVHFNLLSLGPQGNFRW